MLEVRSGQSPTPEATSESLATRLAIVFHDRTPSDLVVVRGSDLEIHNPFLQIPVSEYPIAVGEASVPFWLLDHNWEDIWGQRTEEAIAYQGELRKELPYQAARTATLVSSALGALMGGIGVAINHHFDVGTDFSSLNPLNPNVVYASDLGIFLAQADTPQADIAGVTIGDADPIALEETDTTTEIAQASSDQGQPDFQQITRADIPTDATVEPTPAPVATAEPIIIPTPEPTAAPIPFELRMNADPGVSATDIQYITDGVGIGRTYMQRHFNFDIDGIFNVNIKNDTTIPHSGYRYIEIGTLNRDWKDQSPKLKRGPHEVGHQLEYILTNNLLIDFWGDWFLVEGVAVYINDRALTEAGYYTNNQLEACEIARVVRNPLPTPLRLIKGTQPGPVWSIAMLAIKDMVAQYGDLVIPNYYKALRDNGVENAFIIATGGTSLDQFAAQFDQKRQQLRIPSSWTNADPCAGI